MKQKLSYVAIALGMLMATLALFSLRTQAAQTTRCWPGYISDFQYTCSPEASLNCTGCSVVITKTP